MTTNEVLSTQVAPLELDRIPELGTDETLTAYGRRVRPVRRSVLNRIFGGAR